MLVMVLERMQVGDGFQTIRYLFESLLDLVSLFIEILLEFQMS